MSKTVMINALGDGIRMMTSEEEERRRAKVEQLVCRVTRHREPQSRCSTAAGSVSLYLSVSDGAPPSADLGSRSHIFCLLFPLRIRPA